MITGIDILTINMATGVSILTINTATGVSILTMNTTTGVSILNENTTTVVSILIVNTATGGEHSDWEYNLTIEHSFRLDPSILEPAGLGHEYIMSCKLIPSTCITQGQTQKMELASAYIVQ